MTAYVQTCKICGLKQSASIEHESDCFGSCDFNTKKIRSFEEITMKLESYKKCNPETPERILQKQTCIDILEWVLGEDTL